MCGRFALRHQRNRIREELAVEEWDDEEEFVPRYNIAPRTQVPVMRCREAGQQPVLRTMKWGLVPNWSTVEDKSLSTINARAENLVEGGGMWGPLRGTKRCVIPCQGYYEWLTKGKTKLPHFTKRKDGKMLLMAGLYDTANIEGRTLWTFTIVTTDANKDFSWLHDRQPVMLSSPEAIETWLDTSSKSWSKKLTDIVKPYHDAHVPLECYQVPTEMGKVGTESPSFIEPIAMRKDGIQAMFSKQKQMKRPSIEPTLAPSKKLSTSEFASSSKSPHPVSTPSKKRSRTPEPMSPSKKPKQSSPRKTVSPPTDVKPITAFFTKKT